jgi:hypothetical protein
MSSGAFSMPQIAETVPHSRRIRSTCGPNALKYSIIRVGDQLVVLLALHERGLLGRLAVLETDVGLDVDARHAIVSQARRLRKPGPDVHHVRHGRVPVVVVAAADDRFERFAVIVRHLLASEARMARRDLGRERAQRHTVWHAVVHRAHIARHSRGVQFFHGQLQH